MRTPALVLVALLAVGCEAATDAAGPAASSARFAQGVPGNLPSATGHAEVAFSALRQRYSFTAQRVGKDNRVQGHWELQQDDGGQGASLSGRVTCFVAVDSLARIAGVIDRSDNALFQRGEHVVWKVVDEGEGANEPRDLASAMSPTDDPEGFCGGDSPPMTPILSGNVQVRGFPQEF